MSVISPYLYQNTHGYIRIFTKNEIEQELGQKSRYKSFGRSRLLDQLDTLKSRADNLFIITPIHPVVYMSRRLNQNKSPFLKIVYSQVKINGKVELVPMEMYADGSLKRCEF